VANNLALLLNNIGRLDRVSTQVSVCDRLVDGGNNRGNTWDIVVGAVVSSIGVGGEENLGVSFGFPLVQTADMDGGSWVGVSISTGDGWADPPGIGGVGIVKKGWIGFRLSLAKRGDSKNYDIKIKKIIDILKNDWQSKIFIFC
jgi:hypothetical protein